MLPEFDRPTTAPLVYEQTMRRSASEKLKPQTPSRSPTPLRYMSSTESLDNQENSIEAPYYRLRAAIFKNDNHSVYHSNKNRYSHTNDTVDTSNRNSLYYSSFDTNSPGKATPYNDDEPRLTYRNNQHKVI